jgi:multicomponent Na+:H+ antiporter subunit G
MMDLLSTIAGGGFLLLGSFLCVSSGVGILRFPDFYTRIHAASVTDLGATLILVGLIFYSNETIVTAKLIMIMMFVLITSPVASHALAKSARHSGLKPLVYDQKLRNR